LPSAPPLDVNELPPFDGCVLEPPPLLLLPALAELEPPLVDDAPAEPMAMVPESLPQPVSATAEPRASTRMKSLNDARM
jgi:hypothetical protein